MLKAINNLQVETLPTMQVVKDQDNSNVESNSQPGMKVR